MAETITTVDSSQPGIVTTTVRVVKTELEVRDLALTRALDYAQWAGDGNAKADAVLESAKIYEKYLRGESSE